jgi:predicted dehydrogenase
MNSPLRVGVVGCGAIAQIMHIPYLVEYREHFKLMALADMSRPVLDAVADFYHIADRYTDWRDLLARDDIDAVVLSHSGSHYATVMAALDANKHIFVEKPLAWNLREVEAIADRASKSDRIVQIGYHKLYDPGYTYAREAVQQMKDIGFSRITVLHPANELGFSPYRLRRGNGVIVEGHVDVGTWDEQIKGQLAAFATGEVAQLVDEALGERRTDPRMRLGYGIVTISLIHQIYMMYGFLGEPKRVVSADLWRDGESIHALIEYPNDLRVSIDWHFLSHLKDYREEYAFYGNHERVTLQFPSPYFRNFPSPVIIQGGEGELAWEKKITVSHDEAFRNELLAFHTNVVKNQTPATTVNDALKHARFSRSLIEAMG